VTRSSTRDQRGSIVIALAVVLVLSGLALAVLARTVSAIGSARVSQDDTAAAAAADAGIADAAFALDNGAVPVDTASVTFPASLGTHPGIVSGGTYSWSATATDGGTVVITSVGTVNGRTHQVDATATRPRRWPYPVATSSSLVLGGAGTIDPATAAIASAGALVIDGWSAGSAQYLLGPGASCAGCTAPKEARHAPGFADAVVPTSPAPQPCPGAGTITSLAGGVFVCTAGVTFSGAVPVSGPTVVYVVNGSINFDGSTVNAGGDPTDLVIHLVGPGIVTPGDGAGAVRLTGILDAPRGTLRSSDCELQVDGAMVLGSFDCPTGGGARISYDARVGAVWSEAWQLGAYHDAPVGSAGP